MDVPIARRTRAQTALRHISHKNLDLPIARRTRAQKRRRQKNYKNLPTKQEGLIELIDTESDNEKPAVSEEAMPKWQQQKQLPTKQEKDLVELSHTECDNKKRGGSKEALPEWQPHYISLTRKQDLIEFHDTGCLSGKPGRSDEIILKWQPNFKTLSVKQEQELVVDEDFGDLVFERIGGIQRQGSESESIKRQTPVIKQCTAEIGENQQQNSNSVSDVPFQDILLDANEHSKPPSNMQKEELRDTEVTEKKRPFPTSDTKEQALAVDEEIGDLVFERIGGAQRQGSESESIGQNSVPKQCTAGIGENQQTHKSSSLTELENIAEEKKGDHAEETMEQQNNNSMSDTPFQFILLDAKEHSKPTLKAQREELHDTEGQGKKRPFPISDTEMQELVGDEELIDLVFKGIGLTQRQGSEGESIKKQKSVTKQCITEIGDNQQSDTNSSFIQLEVVTEEEKGDNAEEAMEQKNNNSGSDAPFQDILFDDKEHSKSPSNTEKEEVSDGEDTGKKRPFPISDTEEQELIVDEEFGGLIFETIGGTLKQGSKSECIRQKSVPKQCSADIGENQQTNRGSFHTQLNNNSMSDIPFEDILLDAKEHSKTPSEHDEDVFEHYRGLNTRAGSDDMSKALEFSLKGKVHISDNMDDIDIAEYTSLKIVAHEKDAGMFNESKKDSNVYTEMESPIDGKGDLSCNRGLENCSKECTSVVQKTISPFMCVLMDIEKEAKIPQKLENVFQDQEASQEEKDLEDMWKDMELALKGSTLNSGRTVNDQSSEDFCTAETYMNMYCIGEHEFILDQEIGLICKLCKFVKQEIKSILPPFIPYSGRKRCRQDYGYEDDASCSSDLYFEDHGYNLSSEFHCPSEHSVWNLIPDLKENMYSHQQEAFEFLWRNIGGGLTLENVKLHTSDEVGGCIISHAPGTGKTFLIICFLRTYLELFPRSRPLIIAPFSMLYPWEREFRKWGINIPVYILNRSKTFWEEIDSNYEYSEIVKLAKSNQIHNRNLKSLWRLVMLREWHRRKSVLAVSYNLFVSLTSEGNQSLCEESKHIGKLLLQSPGLVILDEGHQVRNSRSKIFNALKSLNTKLRIILSGTLFQNNFKELFNTLYMVRPTFVDCFLGPDPRQSSTPSKAMSNSRIHITTFKDDENRIRKFFMNEIGNKLQNGKEEFDETLAKFRFMTDDFVHCYDGKILKSLPGIRDFAVILRPSPIQQTVLDQITETNNLQRVSNFEFETMVSCVTIHPSLYRDFGAKRLSCGIDSSLLEAMRKDPYQGVKTKFVLDLVQLSQVIEEKVLLFSQNIPPLVYIMETFETLFSWRKGKEIFQLDGTLPLDERQSVIDHFNDPNGEARVLCASIKACSEGITLTGASRVVFLDLVWNPAIVKQAVSRAFRLGQTKHVYIYRLIACKTMEEEKYQRTVWKDCLSKLVFISPENEEDVDVSESTQTIHCEDKILDKLVELDKETKIFHTIFEHSDLKGKKDPRSESLQGYNNLKDRFHL